MLPSPILPLAEHAEFGQNCFDASIGSVVLFCISTSCQGPSIFSILPPNFTDEWGRTDNGLGKTFLLECAWWALSGHWADPEQPAYPRPDKVGSAIRFQISGSLTKPRTVNFNRTTLTWPLPDEKRPVLPGIVLYARVDG